MLKYHVLASGSKGNATLVETTKTKIVIDVGVGIKELERKLISLNIDINEIDAFLITHEHIDHIRAIQYIPREKIYTGVGFFPINEENFLYAFMERIIGDMKITPLPISHDSLSGFGFVIKNDVEKLVYITDTGYVSSRNIKYMANATHYIIESNHDIQMLYESGRPHYLIRRILSDNGHLNNEECGEVLAKTIDETTKTVTLAHISEVANEPALALTTVKKILKEYGIEHDQILFQVADQEEITKGWDDEKKI